MKPIAPDDRSFLFGGTFMLANRMQAMGDAITGELTTKQWFLLLVLRDAPDLSITEVAEEAGSSRQNVRKLLGQLAAKGYVELYEDPADRRSQLVHMTDRGREYMRAVAVPGRQFIGRIFEGVAEEDIQAMRRAVTRLIENLEEMRDGRE